MKRFFSFEETLSRVCDALPEKNFINDYQKFIWATNLFELNKSGEEFYTLLNEKIMRIKYDREARNMDIISGTEAAYINPISVAEQRKQQPVFSGVLQYFPDAILEVANTSWVGNNQHHPDKPLHWDKSKSTDELDALTRHLMQAGTFDTDGVRHSAKVAWRALANLQREIDLHRLDIKEGH
jgi:hypothetical protein